MLRSDLKGVIHGIAVSVEIGVASEVVPEGAPSAIDNSAVRLGIDSVLSEGSTSWRSGSHLTGLAYTQAERRIPGVGRQ